SGRRHLAGGDLVPGHAVAGLPPWQRGGGLALPAVAPVPGACGDDDVVRPLRFQKCVEPLLGDVLAGPDRRPVPAGLGLEPAGDLAELLAAREQRVPAHVAAGLLLSLDDDHVVPASGGNARVLEAG